MSRSIWHLIHGSTTNDAGGVARRSFVRANSNYNTRMYISEENVSGAWRGKTRHFSQPACLYDVMELRYGFLS